MTIAHKINGLQRYVPVWSVYVMSVIPGALFLWAGITGSSGPEPINVLERSLGEFALQMLILGLAVTPLRIWAGISLHKYRRAIGLVAFGYVFLHLLVWLVLDVGILSQIWADIVKRPYITVGMVAFLLMVPLAITSNNWSIRRLRRTWKLVHKMTYGVALLGGLHFVMLSKGFQLEPLMYLGTVFGLLILRLPPLQYRQVQRN
ncbi:MAG: protein-methionine-sulfoxide reductase heme-binding subunit MsrQ [Pseudoprimorskyibacter sp.]|nr:protein-methionine-sulfoxide reductase heme-binding subunit MsrQ [Pseudoprimorskyibacter sp.]